MNTNMEGQVQGQTAQPQPNTQNQARSYNPFLESVIEKPYSQISVGVTQEQLSSPIPEPAYNSNPIETNRDVYGTLGGDTKGGGGSAPKSAPINPTLNEVPDAEKREAATHLAKLILDGYEGLNKFANQAVQISPRKVRKLVTEGELDLSVQIPYETGATITMGEFIQEFNEQNKDTFVVSKEFRKDVTPVLTRVLEKRGAGLNDEQYLMFAFGKDIAVKAFLGFQIRSALNDVINLGKDYTQAMRESGQVQEPQPTAKPSAQPKPAAKPQETQMYDETINPNAHDFNFQVNEAAINSTVQPMKVPVTGKARVMQQRAKEKVWAENTKKASGSYEQMMKERSTGGKRGRKPKTSQLKEEDIVDAIILQETPNKKMDDKIEGLD